MLKNIEVEQVWLFRAHQQRDRSFRSTMRSISQSEHILVFSSRISTDSFGLPQIHEISALISIVSLGGSAENTEPNCFSDLMLAHEANGYF